MHQQERSISHTVPADQHQEHQTTPMDANVLNSAQNWKLEVDPPRKLVFPPEIVKTTHRPGMILCSSKAKLAYAVELTVPCEDGVEEAYKRKRNQYSNQLQCHISLNSVALYHGNVTGVVLAMFTLNMVQYLSPKTKISIHMPSLTLCPQFFRAGLFKYSWNDMRASAALINDNDF